MGAWDDAIFSEEVNVDFLDELANLDEEDVLEAVEDACTVAVKQDSVSDDEVKNALCAATLLLFGRVRLFRREKLLTRTLLSGK